MRKAIIFIAVAFLLVFCAAPVYATDILPLPHAFCGTVNINGNPAPENTTTVEARGTGVITGIEGNPITVTEEGKFGSTEPLGQKLIVKGDIANGTKISFLVDGIYTDTTFDFKEGETTVLELNLAVTATSIIGEVEEIVPSGQTDYVVDASAEAGTTITVDTTAVVTITVQKYADNPHPDASEAELPAGTEMLPRYIDIEVDNAAAIDWPMHVEQTYTHEEIAGLDESSLGMCYFTDDPLPDGAWHRCSNTDVNEDANYVWADILEWELPGSPIVIGGIAAPPSPTGGVGAVSAPPTYVETTLFGVEQRFRISDDGEILEAIEATSEDGNLTLTIPEGTIALDKEGEPLEGLETAVDESPPDPPEDAHIIGLAYDFGPDGATFAPPLTLEYTYDPADIPEGVAEEDLVLAYYDEDAGTWVELDCVVDTENNTITASVSHFTTFAIIARAAPVLPPEEEVVPPEEEIVPPEEEIVPPPPAVAPPEEEVVPVEPVKPTNWPLIGAIIAGVVLVALLIFFIVVRRRAV